MDVLLELKHDTARFRLEIDHNYRVYVTHINNPHSFYVRLWGYNQYMETVQARGELINKSQLKIGVIVIYKSHITKSYVRGKILFIKGISEPSCDLFALDVGCVETSVPVRRIWKPYYDINLLPLAFHCQLGCCLPRAEKWYDSTIEAMKGYVLGEMANIKVKNILPEVVLVEAHISYMADLATLLANNRFTTFSYMDNVDDQLLAPCNDLSQFYAERTLKEKSVLHVRMQSGSFLDKFYAACVDEYNTFLKVRNEYTNFAKTERSLDLDQLQLNEPVGVFYYRTSKYERGIVRKINPNDSKVKVELVDWGKSVEESVDVMKPIPEKYLQNPPFAIYCALDVSQYAIMSNAEISNLAHLIYPGVEFYVTIEKVADDEDSPNMITVSNKVTSNA